MSNPKFKGIPVVLGGVTYIVPPLNFRSLRELQGRLQSYTGAMNDDTLQLVIDATKAALLRNYLPEDMPDLEEVLDVGNFQEVMEAVMDASGLKRKAFEASSAPTDGNPSTGTTSTGS